MKTGGYCSNVFVIGDRDCNLFIAVQIYRCTIYILSSLLKMSSDLLLLIKQDYFTIHIITQHIGNLYGKLMDSTDTFRRFEIKIFFSPIPVCSTITN